MLRVKTTVSPFCAIVFCALLPQIANAGVAGGCTHNTDGAFGVGEWSCGPVSKQFFVPAARAGGSFLYVAQGVGPDNTLYLMYDYVAGTATSSFFDVFFEVVPDGHAYLVHIDGSSTVAPGIGGAYERLIGLLAPLNPNGSF